MRACRERTSYGSQAPSQAQLPMPSTSLSGSPPPQHSPHMGGFVMLQQAPRTAFLTALQNFPHTQAAGLSLNASGTCVEDCQPRYLQQHPQPSGVAADHIKFHQHAAAAQRAQGREHTASAHSHSRPPTSPTLQPSQPSPQVDLASQPSLGHAVSSRHMIPL